MTEKRFTGICTFQQLARFSVRVIGTASRPTDTLIIPISRNRRNAHLVWNAGNALIQPHMIVKTYFLNIAVYQENKVIKARWVSRRQNEVLAEKQKDGIFFLSLIERISDCCHWRTMLSEMHIALTLQN